MKKKNILKFLSLLLTISLFFNTSTISQAKSKVKLNKTKVVLAMNNIVDLTVKNTSKKPKWSSSNKSVAIVNSDGEVKAINTGIARIKAKIGNKKYTCTVIVPKQFISNKSITLRKGESKKLQIYGISKTDEITWTSTDDRVADISESGNVIGKKSGKAIIYAILNYGVGKTYKCEVTITDESSSSNPIPTTTLVLEYK